MSEHLDHQTFEISNTMVFMNSQQMVSDASRLQIYRGVTGLERISSKRLSHQMSFTHSIRATRQQYALGKRLLNRVYNVCGMVGDKQHQLGLAWVG